MRAAIVNRDTGDEQPQPKLTERQRLALEHIGANQPVTSEQLGAFLHADRQARGGSGHPADTVCDFCPSEGAQMGRALRKKGLVTQKAKLGWCLTGYTAARPHSPLQAASDTTDDQGFPKGF